MPEHCIGQQAIVVGAGIGGLTAAAILTRYFSRVTILERDDLPAGPAHRAGVPQGRHVHALQGGGLIALGRIFPGFAEALAAAGAVPIRMGLDARVEQPGYDPFPRRDLGQGMSVAAKEAILLGEVFQAVSGSADPLADLATAFFGRLDEVLADPWAVAEQDYIYPHLRAMRPAGFEDRVQLQAAVTRLAAVDPSIHRLMAEVAGMIRSTSAYREPEIAGRIAREMRTK